MLLIAIVGELLKFYIVHYVQAAQPTEKKTPLQSPTSPYIDDPIEFYGRFYSSYYLDILSNRMPNYRSLTL
jgi:hypothetical protein